MMKLRINPIVAEDLKKIKEYIAEDNEEMAVKTIQEIYARFENIQQFTYMGADLAKRVSLRTFTCSDCMVSCLPEKSKRKLKEF